MAFWPMRNIETFPSQQMYLYLSLVERKVTEFYHNIDRRHYLVWFKWLIFNAFSGQLMVSLQNSSSPIRHQVKVPESQSSEKMGSLKNVCWQRSPVEQKGLRRLEAWGLVWGGLGTARVWEGGWSGYAGSGHRRPVQAAQISPARVGTSQTQLILSHLLCSPSVLLSDPGPIIVYPCQ